MKEKAKVNKKTPHIVFDQYLLLATIALLAIGLVMVASASMAISERQFGDPFHYFLRQAIYVFLGVIVAIVVVRIDLNFWQRISGYLLLIGFFLLVLVLIPGIGREVNGSRRWINLIVFELQVSELIKLVMVIYIAGYLVRRSNEVLYRLRGFIKPMLVLGVVGVLLLAEPDFGATVVVAVTVLSMMYLAGMRTWQFAVLVVFVAVALALLAVSSPYRLLRLTTFMHPWLNPYGSGYQLTQSLIAYGRGGLFGVGLGGSIMKLFYLPEAHTDFLFSVLAEELGLLGILSVIALYTIFIWRALFIGKRAQLIGMHREGFMAYGFAIWMAIQAAVNIGMTAGLFPTKGLTLPFMSYGGSSMIIDCVVVAMLLRIDYEVRKYTPSAQPRSRPVKL